MTLDDFRDLLLTVDQDATRYEHTGVGNYTTWREYGTKPLGANNRRGEVIYRVQVDRFTKLENDPTAAAITTLLDGQDTVAFQYLVDYEVNTGYIHHIWDCEVA